VRPYLAALKTQPQAECDTTDALATQHQKPTIRPCITTTNDMHLLREYNKQYLGYADYDPIEAVLGKTFYDNYLLLATDGNDISNTASQHAELATPPSPYSLIRESFRQPSTDHAFQQQAFFEITYVLVISFLGNN
jgi:hypothetical protein